MWRSFFTGLVDIVYPKTCSICSRSLRHREAKGGFVCSPCWGKIKKNLPPFCYSCGRHLESTCFCARLCLECRKKKLYFDRAFSPCTYEGVMRELIHAFKYEGKDYLGSLLSQLIVECIREYDIPMQYIDMVVPVPLHRAKEREREFNQAEILARCIAQEFNKEMNAHVLTRIRHTKTQTAVEHEDRFENVRGSFAWNPDHEVKNKHILLVDDVLTSAATASEAARVLKEWGAGMVFVATIAN